MKTIIAGIRTLTDYKLVCEAMSEFKETVTEVVSGGARGADALGEQWANMRGIAIKRFPADWNAHGKAAGPIRNRQMAHYAEALVAIWDGQSKGTKKHDRRSHETRACGVCEKNRKGQFLTRSTVRVMTHSVSL